jgi:PTS system cellobiose-specific IIC component
MAVAGGISSQRHIAAVRDGLKVLMPLLVAVSVFDLLDKFPAGTFADGSARYLGDLFVASGWLMWLPYINKILFYGVYGVVAALAVLPVAHSLAKSYDDVDSALASATALAVYLCMLPSDIREALLRAEYTAPEGVFSAVLVALVAGEIFSRLSKTGKAIRTPSFIPPAAVSSFVSLAPVFATLFVMIGASELFKAVANRNALELVNILFANVLVGIGGSFAFGLIIVLLTNLCWAFGVHGMHVFEFLLLPFVPAIMLYNHNAILTGNGQSYIFNKLFLDTFVHLGGSGVCFSLALALVVAGRSKRLRKLGAESLSPTALNISETLIFGLPIVFNPVFAIPFVLAPLVCFLVSYIATASGFMPPVAYLVPWTTPPVLSGFLATGWAWQGAAVQLACIGLATLVYIPFVFLSSALERKKSK